MVVLLARPVRVESQDRSRRPVVAVLLDRSRSMGLLEEGRTRYVQAEEVARKTLVPALESAGYRVEPVLFAESARESPTQEWAGAAADGFDALKQGAGDFFSGIVKAVAFGVGAYVLVKLVSGSR